MFYQNKEKFVKEVFDSISNRYDLMNNILSLGLHKLWRKKAISQLSLISSSTPKNILDLCCGTCDLSIAISKLMLKNKVRGKVIGLDFSEKMLLLGKKKILRNGLQGIITLMNGDATKTSFKDCTFDYVVIGFGLRNLSNLVISLKEIFRILKVGGKVVILELSKSATPFFCKFYNFYVTKIIPLLGFIVTFNFSAYKWLPFSLLSFPDCKELAVLMEEVGFRDVKYLSLNFGIAFIHTGIKK